MSVNLNDYLLEQWLLRAASGDYSSGSPENPGRFKALQKSAAYLDSAPSRSKPHVSRVIEIINEMVRSGNYLSGAALGLEIKAAIAELKTRS